jgi:hypothetical protein
MRSTLIVLVSLAASWSMTASIRGSVKSLGAGPDAAARPVAGARVTLQCAERAPLEIGITDAAGRFARDVAEPSQHGLGRRGRVLSCGP